MEKYNFSFHCITEQEFVSKLAERVHSFMMSVGEPLTVQKLSNAFELPREPVNQALQILLLNNKIQRGNRGWRAL